MSPLYAVIDLGSNSFHMLITRLVADSVLVVDKVKRKVRLASGLNSENILDDAAIARGLECLRFFAERLQDIPQKNVRIVATATLRLATNRDKFLIAAQAILGQNINLLSGEQEAENIYLGVAHTSCGPLKRFVIDIGGASTELILGDGYLVKQITSLDMGCVTFNNLFFPNGYITPQAFTQAIQAAKNLINPLIATYQKTPWEIALGGSGTIQALAEMQSFNHQSTGITLEYLNEIKHSLINCKTIKAINLAGLTPARTPVITSGLAILIAVFESFDLKEIQLSNGALREGLLYEMLPKNKDLSIRQRTINSLTEKFHVDIEHAKRIKKHAGNLFSLYENIWSLDPTKTLSLLNASCDLHEIGLLLEYKNHQQHSAYVLKHVALPGFYQKERQLIVALVLLYKGDIDTKVLQSQSMVDYQQACYLLVILRLAVILCRRRKDEALPNYQTTVDGNRINLCLPKEWLEQHPLIKDELQQENEHLAAINLSLNMYCE
ncbi:MAG: exopolyphosphatase/guanosine-5'-triphosphate,3'-diphosphate pyrophosphatase [Alteromonadaceae bacterium]|jgi:exopolyphosphatase/guanosine-5'-triphosphate,3'-diphosphate pyrophosphatase